MLNSLRNVVTDVCASCTQPSSVFKQSFERAERGYTQSSSSPSLNMGAQPTMSNEI